MKATLAALRLEFPDLRAVALAPMALPLFYARLDVEVMEEQELTTFQNYLLHAVALGMDTPAQLSWLLGVHEEELAVPAGALLQEGYVTLTPSPRGTARALSLTPLGKQVVEKGRPLPVPRQRVAHIHFNAVTWQPIPREDDALSADEMRAQGLPVVPAGDMRRPTLGDFSEQEVKAALNNVTTFQAKEVIAILGLRKLEPEYLSPVYVVLLENANAAEQRVVVYRDDVRQEAESRVLQRLFETGHFTMPREATFTRTMEPFLPPQLAPDIARPAAALIANEQRLAELTTELGIQQELHAQSRDDRERRELAGRIATLEEQLLATRAENEQLRQQVAGHQVTLLRTEEHRAFLEGVLRDAREEVLIISPWVNSVACDAALCRLFGMAASRGVKIRIGHGMGNEKPHDADRNRRSLNRVRQAIERQIQGNPSGSATPVEWCATSGTHQKIVVCDRRYAAVGSFNWLSYRGELDAGYRRELSSVFRDEEIVTQIVEIALEALRS